MNLTESVGGVLPVQLADVVEVVFHAMATGGWKEGAILPAFAVTDRNDFEVEVDVLDAEAEALEDAHAGAVEEHDDELDGALEPGHQ